MDKLYIFQIERCHMCKKRPPKMLLVAWDNGEPKSRTAMCQKCFDKSIERHKIEKHITPQGNLFN